MTRKAGGDYMHAMALVHEGESKVMEAEARLAQQQGRVGRFIARIRLSQAENSLAHRYVLRDKAYAGEHTTVGFTPEEPTITGLREL